MDEEFEFFDLINQLENENNLLHFELLDFFNSNIKKRQNVKKRINPFVDYFDHDFKQRFRFSKDEVNQLYNSINGPQYLEPMV